MIILLDCDGVLADFSGALLDVVNKEDAPEGKVFTRNDLSRWDVAGCLHLRRDRLSSILSREGFVVGMAPLPGAQKAVYELCVIGTVYIVTTPFHSSPTWAYERTEWLSRHFGIHAERVIHTAAKELVRGDLFVDDKPSHILSWQQSNKDGVSILWEATWNSKDRYHHPGSRLPVNRMNDWGSLVRIAQMENERLDCFHGGGGGD
jgi:5'(3')-deoxyribonucleotidase